MDIFVLIKFFNEHDLWPHGLSTLHTGEKTAVLQYLPHPHSGICILDTAKLNDNDLIRSVAVRGLLDRLKNSDKLRRILMSYKQGTDFLEHIVERYEAFVAESEEKLAKSEKPEVLETAPESVSP
ncbi:MAG: hypothetical protein IID32_02430 [Planctomycetes bacterium]|nr:hypothetical protein [Planctomycetota bacterium]